MGRPSLREGNSPDVQSRWERKLANVLAGRMAKRCLGCLDTLCRSRVRWEQLLVLSLVLGQRAAASAPPSWN